jgi:hypothetical protein
MDEFPFYKRPNGKLRVFISTAPRFRMGAAWPRLGRARFVAPVSRQTSLFLSRTQSGLSLTALSLTPCHPHSDSVLSFSPSRSFSSAGAHVKNENKPATAEKEKTMKLEEIKNKTNEAVSYLVAALESGQSEVLTQYLNAMARFHNYSFGNIMLIARQKPQATNVAGIRTWNSLGRFVKRGEKDFLILAPMIGRKKTDGAAESTSDAKGSTAQLFGFRAVYVFDVSQTEQKRLS